VVETDNNLILIDFSLTKSFLAFAVSMQTIISKPLGSNWSSVLLFSAILKAKK